MIVMPTLLTSARRDRRAGRAAGGSSPGEFRTATSRFALLSDWTDSSTESEAGDDDLLSEAAEGIAGLNRRYGPAPGGDRFLLLHRRRLWNEGQGKWIGWERKRGKLHELNRLLRGATDTSFMPIGGRSPIVPADVRYVITLDADTRLPRGAAKRLIGKMAHPLNRPTLDSRSCRVIDGYAVLQPRVTPSLPTQSRRIAVPAGLLECERPGPLRLRGLGRVPGSFRRRLVLRQGDLRCRSLRSRARRADTREHAAQSRSSGGHLRAGRSGFRHRSHRRVSGALRRRRGAPASVGARRLAVAALDSRSGAAREWRSTDTARSRSSAAGR